MSNFTRSGLIGIIFTTLMGAAGAGAQEGTTFLTFQGTLFILDNPTSATCQAHGINFSSVFTVLYRFSLNPAVVSDAFAIKSDRGEAQMYSTQSPGFSLNGSSTTGWNYINKYASYGTLSPSSSNMLIQGGGGAVPISSGSNVARITGSINDFLAISGCNIASLRAALSKVPD